MYTYIPVFWDTTVCRSLRISPPFRESYCSPLLLLEFHSIADVFAMTVAAWQLNLQNAHNRTEQADVTESIERNGLAIQLTTSLLQRSKA